MAASSKVPFRSTVTGFLSANSGVYFSLSGRLSTTLTGTVISSVVLSGYVTVTTASASPALLVAGFVFTVAFPPPGIGFLILSVMAASSKVPFRSTVTGLLSVKVAPAPAFPVTSSETFPALSVTVTFTVEASLTLSLGIVMTPPLTVKPSPSPPVH